MSYLVKRRFLIAVFAAMSVLPLQCATLERLALTGMITQSTAIVRGKVTGSFAAFTGPLIYTHYQIQVSETFKGSSQKSVEVVVPGGIAKNLRQTFAGAPQFNNGDDYVFFLWTGKSGLTQIMGLTQGLFAVAPGGTSNPTVTRGASHELMLDPSTGRQVKDETLVMTLNDLRSQIASTLAPGAAE